MTRRHFLSLTGGTAVGLVASSACNRDGPDSPRSPPEHPEPARTRKQPTGTAVTLFLAGDVMTGRGIDQILPHPVPPTLYESYVKDARQYVELAEHKSGSFERPVTFDYVWGDALAELAVHAPHARIVNLETSVTTSDRPAPKGIHYRMHPSNVAVLTKPGIDCCTLANNHVLDWGATGLRETLEVLHRAGIKTAGAGLSASAAAAPAVIEPEGTSRRILVFAFGTPSSGIPESWLATAGSPGVHWLREASAATARDIAPSIRKEQQTGDVVVISVHWGGNWGYDVPEDHVAFAHTLVDEAGVDVVFGHSSHHAKGIEVYRDRPIFYGAGDFLNDYEGISGHDEYRDDLPLMYFLTMGRGGELSSLVMVPMQLKRLRLERASEADTRWLVRTLDRECSRLGARVAGDGEGRLTLRW